MLRQEADQADQPEQSDQIPDEVAGVGSARDTVLGLRAETAALFQILRRSRANCRGHQEQREYHSPTHWHPPSLIVLAMPFRAWPRPTFLQQTGQSHKAKPADCEREHRSANARIDLRS